jgi:acyl-CoA thioester hydrolase
MARSGWHHDEGWTLMAKPEAWRLNPAAYPFTFEVATRWADLDMLGHINNVSMAALFEEGRGKFTHSLAMHRSSNDIRWLIVGVEIAYLAEAHHPEPVTVASGIGRIGATSWSVMSAAFQGGKCVATCETTTAYTDANGAAAIPDDYRAKLEAMSVRRP